MDVQYKRIWLTFILHFPIPCAYYDQLDSILSLSIVPPLKRKQKSYPFYYIP